ncbi:MAG TPA: DUF2259 domain-containing protein [Devosia sp.]|nr:DUF2259 domain-containing protein [Devosia sp.]
MKPNVAPMASARLAKFSALLGGVLLAGLLAVPVLAGDRAGIGFIGYSPDGRYFAFDEFGIQDGSGFAYANLYVMDATTDQWVKGTPVRVRHEDEASTIIDVRAEARDTAQETLDRLAIAEPVDILALNGDGAVAEADMQTLRFGKPGYGLAMPEQNYELRLATVTAKLEQKGCAEWSESDITGFALNLTTNGQTKEVYRDQTVPKSRGCPQGYRLYGVVAPFDSFATFGPDLVPGMVAIVSVYSTGFEGPDRRFIAVPFGL